MRKRPLLFNLLLYYGLCVTAIMGQSGVLHTHFIVHGVPVAEHELNWMVSIQHKVNGKMSHKCGGVLVADDLILTAGHCLLNDTTQIAIENTMICVRGGSADRQNASLYQSTDCVLPQASSNLPMGKLADYAVSNMYFPDGHQFRTHWTGFHLDDLALLRLTAKVNTSSQAFGIIELPSNASHKQARYWSGAYVAGWGLTKSDPRSSSQNRDRRKLSRDLRKARVLVVPCDEQVFGEHSEKLICTNSTYADVCEGDSGGALYHAYQDVMYGNLTYRLIGVTSASSAGCARPNAVSVHYRLDKYMAFLRNHTS